METEDTEDAVVPGVSFSFDAGIISYEGASGDDVNERYGRWTIDGLWLCVLLEKKGRCVCS